MFLCFSVIIAQNHSCVFSIRSVIYSWGTDSASHFFLTLADSGCHGACTAGFIILGSQRSLAWSLAWRDHAGKGILRKPGMSSSIIPADSIPNAAEEKSSIIPCWSTAPLLDKDRCPSLAAAMKPQQATAMPNVMSQAWGSAGELRPQGQVVALISRVPVWYEHGCGTAQVGAKWEGAMTSKQFLG